MVLANIQFNGVSGSNPPNGGGIEPGDVITVNSTTNGGELTWLWEFLDIPEGSLAVFANANLQTTTFTADTEGTYLVRVTVNRTLASEQSDTAILGVRQVRNPTLRVPAAFETTEYNAEGWSKDVNTALKLLDSALSDSNRRVGVAVGGTLLRGQVVAQTENYQILVGLPGEAIVAGYTLALATSADDTSGSLFVVEGAADGTTAAAAGALVVVRALGLFGPMTPVGLTVGADVYLSDAGILDNVAGTIQRRVGRCITSIDANEWVQFDGISGADAAVMALEPYLFTSAPAGTYPGSQNLSALTSPVDIVTAANVNHLRLTRRAGQTASMVLMRDELGSDLMLLRANGDVHLLDPDVGGLRTVTAPDSALKVTSGAATSINAATGSPINLQINNTTAWAVTSAGALAAQGGTRLISNVADPLSDQDAVTRASLIARLLKYPDTFMCGNTATAATECFLDPGFVDRTAPLTADPKPSVPTWRAGTIKQLIVTARVGPIGGDQEVEILAAGTPTGVTVLLLDGSSAVQLTDNTHTSVVASGAVLSVRVKPSGAVATGAVDVVARFDIQPDF